jgi:hypothetical protein
MLPLGDPRWNELPGGYGTPFDPSDLLRRLEGGKKAWDELWQELHHQGDVGVASYVRTDSSSLSFFRQVIAQLPPFRTASMP